MEMSDNLINWIEHEINTRGWSIRELARRSELAPTTISDVLGNRARAGLQFCNGIARAFKVPPERVFREAGLLPAVIIGQDDEQKKKELDDYWKYLTTGERDTLTTMARALYERRTAYDVRKPDKERTDDKTAE